MENFTEEFRLHDRLQENIHLTQLPYTEMINM